MFRSHDRRGRVEQADGDGGERACVHVVPLHEGWTEDETVAWLGQGLELPAIDPPQWSTIVWRPAGDCEICRY